MFETDLYTFKTPLTVQITLIQCQIYKNRVFIFQYRPVL